VTPAERLLERLDGVRPNGKSRWTARCPSHADKTSSLSIREIDDGRVLAHCFGGCTTPAVLAAVGLEIRDLFIPRETNSRPAESERDRLEREFNRKHPTADESFFESWVQLHGAGWRELGTPVGRAAMEYAATANVPDLPGELIAHHRLGLDVPLERPPFGPKNLEALASWLAECLRAAFQPLEQLSRAEFRTATSTSKEVRKWTHAI
jgi:hypothetical protein